MLRQVSRRCRLLALLRDKADSDSTTSTFADILEPEYSTVRKSLSRELKSGEVTQFLGKAPHMTPNEYTQVKDYLNFTGLPYRAYTNLPHPEHALVLPPTAARPLGISHGGYGREYSCSSSHPGNSHIEFNHPQTHTRGTGSIQLILETPLEGFIRPFLFVQPHKALEIQEERRTPFYQRPWLKSRTVDIILDDNVFVMEPQHIITHLTTLERPAGTYGIKQKFQVVCWGLDRRRKD